MATMTEEERQEQIRLAKEGLLNFGRALDAKPVARKALLAALKQSQSSGPALPTNSTAGTASAPSSNVVPLRPKKS
jgi:hypothetical protein